MDWVIGLAPFVLMGFIVWCCTRFDDGDETYVDYDDE
jgi:hypothetical protein